MIDEVIDESKPITFAPLEWKYFKLELNGQAEEGKGFDFLKALHNARYFAEIERSTEQYKQGKVVTFTEKEWEALANV